jgi:hypothetical protein
VLHRNSPLTQSISLLTPVASPSSHRGDRKVLVPSNSESLSESGDIRAVATAFLNAVEKQFPSSQEKRGDDKLTQARDILSYREEESSIAKNDLKVLQDKVVL